MLKEKLKTILENDKLPSNIDNYEFALELMDNIGSTDSELRDDLVLTVLWNMIIAYDALNTKELKKLLNVCISEKHLYKNIGSIGDDVFDRAFTALIIGVIISYDNEKKEIFTEEEFKYVFDSIIKYAKKEIDVRGYVDVKGWAHSTAHTADVLAELTLSRFNTKELSLELLSIIKEKICNDYYSYINDEDERLIFSVINIIEKNMAGNSEIVNWIKSFGDIDLPKKYPEENHLNTNRKNFLRSLYFRMTNKNVDNQYIDEVLKIINNTNRYINRD